jgi:DNA polymerase III delta prime subunit
MPFQKAAKQDLNLRLALHGPSGSGKTRSALEIARHLGNNIALIDTEHRSACRYAHLVDFDTQNLTDHNPATYIRAIKEAGTYDVLIIDSLSHAWGWELETVDKNFRNWAIVRPIERQLLQAILAFPGHIIVTMRSKTEWLLQDGTNKSGKATTTPKKVGTAPVQSPSIEYEFDLVLELGMDHTGTVTKSRFDLLDQGEFPLPGEEFADLALKALHEGGDPPQPSYREHLMAESDRLIQSLNWSPQDARSFLQQCSNSNHPSRKDLNDIELAEFNSQLSIALNRVDPSLPKKS